jgi:hypothetical protein
MVYMAQNNGLKVTTNEKWALKMTVDLAFKIAPILSGRNWLVVHRPSDRQSFVTTDAPVVLSSLPTEGAPSVFDGAGFATANALISLALDQTSALQMHGFDGDTVHQTLDRDGMRRANLHLASACQRYLFGRDEQLVRSLASELDLARTAWTPKLSMQGG